MNERLKLRFKFASSHGSSSQSSTDSLADSMQQLSSRSASQPIFQKHLSKMERQISLPEKANPLSLAILHNDLEAIDEESMNQAYVCHETTENSKLSSIVGPGGVPIPQLNHLKHLVPNGHIKLMCITWNMASRSQSTLTKICELAVNKDTYERLDIIAISLQELPLTNTKYHQDAVQILSDSLRDSHIVFCWVRKWTQMLMVFIRSELIKYASHGPLVYRRNDYLKIYDSLKLTENGKRKQPDGVFWFGDLNFRILSRKRFDELKERNRYDNPNCFFADLLADDELTIEKTKGSLFEGFIEATICFPPTHKFVVGTHDYAENRIPSYTDRVLYFSKDNSRIQPVTYASLWEENSSDHKPVFAIFNVRVTDCCS